MNKYQRIICRVAKCDMASDKRTGLPVMDFRTAKKIARKVHREQSVSRMIRYIKFVEAYF